MLLCSDEFFVVQKGKGHSFAAAIAERHSRRQLLANAAIAASRLSAYRSRRQPVFQAAKLVAGRPVHVVQEDDAAGPLSCLSLSSQRLKSAARSFAPTPTALAPASPISRSPRQLRASCAWPQDRSFAARGCALPRRAPASGWDH